MGSGRWCRARSGAITLTSSNTSGAASRKYLGETDRERLVELYGLDGARLRPPKRPALTPVIRPREKTASDDSWINPRCDNLVEQASKAEINHLLDHLSGKQLAFVHKMILAAVGLAGKSAPRGKDAGAMAA